MSKRSRWTADQVRALHTVFAGAPDVPIWGRVQMAAVVTGHTPCACQQKATQQGLMGGGTPQLYNRTRSDPRPGRPGWRWDTE